MDRIAKLKEFLQLSPKDSFLRHALALELIKIGEESEARKVFETLLNDDPAYVGSYLHLGMLLNRQNETAKAIACFELGMQQAKQANDEHALRELRAAYDEMM